jgi:FtsZ-binding cell division protein ZapB
MPDSNDRFAKLEEKLFKAIEVFKRTQEEKRALEEGLEKLRKDSKDHTKRVDSLERELVALRREREEVRARIEKLLSRIDALTSPDSER